MLNLVKIGKLRQLIEDHEDVGVNQIVQNVEALINRKF